MNIPELPYDYEDFGMTQDELAAKYPQGHDEYTLADWLREEYGELSKSVPYWTLVMQEITKDDELY